MEHMVDRGCQFSRDVRSGCRGRSYRLIRRPSVIKARVRSRAYSLRSNRGVLTSSRMDAAPPGPGANRYRFAVAGGFETHRGRLAGRPPSARGLTLGRIPGGRGVSISRYARLESLTVGWNAPVRSTGGACMIRHASICVVGLRGRRCRDSLTSRTAGGLPVNSQ